MERKIQLLGIAPYEGMKEMMIEISSRLDQADITAFTGDLQQGVDIVQNMDLQHFDAIISRGATAEAIRRVSSLPVFSIPLSVTDIFRAIKLAEAFHGKYAIIGFPSITKSARTLCTLLNWDVRICTIQRMEQAEPFLRQLKEEGCQLVVCDVFANQTAHQLGMESILFSSGIESIEDTVQQALDFFSWNHLLQSQNRYFCSLLKGNPVSSMLLDQDGKVVCSTLEASLEDSLLPFFLEKLPELLSGEKIRKTRQSDGKIYHCIASSLYIGETPYVSVYVQTYKMPPELTGNSILYQNGEDISSHSFSNYYMESPTTRELLTKLSHYSPSSLPVLVLGEQGTAKDRIVDKLFVGSPAKNAPLVRIHCRFLTDKQWGFLMKNSNSPLADTGLTIHFKEINALGAERFQQLSAYIEETNMAKRIRLFFTYQHTEDTEREPIYQYLTTSLSCLLLKLPSLRERRNDIPYLANIYLNQINLSQSRQVAGFEAGAMEAVQNYPWPYNLDQFHRVLRELAVESDVPYITLEQVKKALESENKDSSPLTSQIPFSLEGTLDEINRRLVQHILAEEGGNQSRTASRLGISRTTLWRMLK